MRGNNNGAAAHSCTRRSVPLLLLLLVICWSSTCSAFLLPTTTTSTRAQRRERPLSFPSPHPPLPSYPLPPLFSLSNRVGEASKRLYNKLRKNVWSRYSLTGLRAERGGRLGRAEIPHDEVTFRRRGPDRELTSIPQAERYSSGDWLHNILNLPGSQVLARIKGVILLNMVWAMVVSSVVSYFNWPAIPSRVHTLLGSSLGLLLVFRTNTSYGRYWEGRVLWEKLHSKTRDIARMVSIYEDCIGTEKVTAAARLLCAYPLVLREHLTGETHKTDISRLLGPQLSDTMDCAVNKPLWLCNRLSLLFRGVPESKNFSSRERLALLALVNDLSSIIGSCERLVQTPVPLSYARHTSRFLTLYLWSLPFVLVADFKFISLALITGLCTWALFGILEIGLLIEDPFQRILRTSWTGVIADTVMRDVQWNIAENRGSSSGQASREPPYSPGPAPGTPLDAMPL